MQPQVVVVGGGFGGLEATFLLRHRLGERVGITLVSPEDAFAYRPGTIYVPFGADPQALMTPIAPALRRRDVTFVRGHASGLSTERRELRVVGRDGALHRLRFDFLVIASGAEVHPAEVPGLERHGAMLWGMRDALALRRAFQAVALESASRRRREVVLLVPRGNRWPGPIYELALMLDTWLRRRRARRHVGITLVTHEHGFLHVLGPRMDEMMRRTLERRGITGRARTGVREVTPYAVRLDDGTDLPLDLLVSFPAQVAAVPFQELPRDPRGFVMTTAGSREVLGAPGVYAVGDAASWPVKQALVAVEHAGAAVDHIEATVLGREPERGYRPQTLWLMDQLDTASFAQVPLRDDGEPAGELGATSDALRYRVGTSVLWRVAKRFVGVYVPWRYRQGLPCHGSTSGSVMNAGLRVMAGTLAR
ncbi:MAG TPA: FAD-dependent oxidoreductase [Gemmatimonadaceae bacterium]